MAKSYTSLKQVLIDKLEAMNGVDGNSLFAGVYDNEETNPEGFPSAFVVESAGEGSILDTARNEREWQFDIHIYHEAGKKSPENVSEAVIDAVDRVIEDFDEDPMLKDEHDVARAKWVRVVPVEFEFGTRETAMSRATLRISIVDLVHRFS